MAGARPPPALRPGSAGAERWCRACGSRGAASNGSDQRCGAWAGVHLGLAAAGVRRRPYAARPRPDPPARCRRFAALGRATPRSPLPPHAQLGAEELAGAGARRQQSEPGDHYREGAVEGESLALRSCAPHLPPPPHTERRTDVYVCCVGVLIYQGVLSPPPSLFLWRASSAPSPSPSRLVISTAPAAATCPRRTGWPGPARWSGMPRSGPPTDQRRRAQRRPE